MDLNKREIRLSSVEIKNDNTIVYHYDAGSFMRRFLTREPLRVQYEGSVRDIPPGIAVIPFLGIMAPIVWFYRGILDIAELDATYAESMDNVRAVYQDMYPRIHLSGRINIGRKTSTLPGAGARKGALFTGGIDSMATVLHHRQENPLLISIWGSEQRLHQKRAWRQVNEAQITAARELGLKRTIIASNYLEIIKQRELHTDFPGRLLRPWYVEVAYGPLLLGLSAPLTWREGINTIYMASSYTAENKPPDGSRPALVENMSWSGTRAVYDGGDEDRQQKFERIIRLTNRQFPGLKLIVCDQGKDEGINCSLCEKCSRTIAALALMGINPGRYGFVTDANTPETIRHSFENNKRYIPFAWQQSNIKFWKEIQEKVPEYREVILPPWREFFNWLSGVALDDYVTKPFIPWREEIKRLVKRSYHSLFLR